MLMEKEAIDLITASLWYIEERRVPSH